MALSPQDGGQWRSFVEPSLVAQYFATEANQKETGSSRTSLNNAYLYCLAPLSPRYKRTASVLGRLMHL